MSRVKLSLIRTQLRSAKTLADLGDEAVQHICEDLHNRRMRIVLSGKRDQRLENKLENLSQLVAEGDDALLSELRKIYLSS